VTWGEYAERVRRISEGLTALEVRPADTVALMMTNRPEFHLCDTAAMHLGATAFSVYNTLAPDTLRHVLGNSGARIVICEEAFLERINAARSGTAAEHVVCIDGAGGTMTLAQLEQRRAPGFDFEASWQAVTAEKLLTLIYTSGTTGPPKGVELTHANMLAELRGTAEVLPLRRGDRVPSALPMAHAAERWGSHYRGMAHGLDVTCVRDLRALPAVLTQIRPTVWGSVPRVWEKLHAGLRASLAREPEAALQRIEAAIDVGRRVVRAEQQALASGGNGPEASLVRLREEADRRVLGQLRDRLGLDRLRWAIVGAAPTPPHILEFFAAIGIPMCELWGMSELTTVATVNPPEASRLGTVGLPLPGVELRLDEDGEILVRGDIVMRGYRDEPEKTRETIDPDGWLRTGDVGRLDADGYLRIVDRKKELMINAAGKNMSPANIEAAIKGADNLIGQAIAIGDGRPYNVALLVLDPDACAGELDGSARPDELAGDRAIQSRLEEAIERANGDLARVEQIRRFTVLPDTWEPGSELMTPTMKLKRKAISERYRREIDALYDA
jgi:long-subunit acyl-CoA synthetase (AMP-forming)